MYRLTLAFLVCVWLGTPVSLWAQSAPAASPPPAPAPANEPPPPAGSAAAAPSVTPPELLQFVEAPHPPEALAQGLSARVQLELVIAVDGSVTEAKVVKAAGHGFDESALTAAHQLKFKPAARNGTPVPARVSFEYVFEWRAPNAPAAEIAAAGPPELGPAHLEGRVLNADDDNPLAGVEILATDAAGQTQRTVSDAQGRFSIAELPAGAYRIALNKAPQWKMQESQEQLVGGQATELVYRLQPAPDPDAFRAVTRVPPPPREVTRRTIGKQELTRIPGTRGDALRTVELLPGVARPPLGAGLLIVRGSSPNDTQVFLEGIPVPLLYHFGGLTSFINSRFLESVDFYPGNFGVRYGRRRGGIIEAQLVEPPRDRVETVLDTSLIDGSVVVRGPLAEDWDFAVAARRSWLDVVLGSALESTDINTIAAPVYYDYQAMAGYRPTEKDKLRLLVYGSSDRLELLFQQPSDADAAVRGDFNVSTQFHRAHMSWNRKVSDRVDHDLEVAGGGYDVAFGLGEAFDFSLTGADVYVRSEWRARANDRVQLIAGLDVAYLPGKVEYTGPPPSQNEGNPDNGTNSNRLSNRQTFVTSDEFNIVQPALYLESALDLRPLRLVLGARVDYFSEIQAFTFDPRVSLHVALDDRTRLKAGVGMFTQPPNVGESSPAFGNPGLAPTRTMQYALGIERDIVPGFSFGVEGFYKYMYERVLGTEFGAPPYFENGGEGRIYGLEVAAKVEPRGRFFGYLSYTLSRSERLDRDGSFRLFDFDQPHILTLAGVYRLGDGWELGGTFRLVSGNPDTPVIGAYYNKDTDLYSPIFGATNSIRSPYFHRLDVRIEKMWTFSSWKLAVYLDVQNVYNAASVEGIIYDFEYRTSQNITGIPILPNLGVRGEF
jgi:TonB family protein